MLDLITLILVLQFINQAKVGRNKLKNVRMRIEYLKPEDFLSFEIDLFLYKLLSTFTRIQSQSNE